VVEAVRQILREAALAVARILGEGVCQRTRVFSELQSHYVFADRLGRPGEGNKGKVEGLIGWIHRNLLVTAPRATSLTALNEQLLEACRCPLGIGCAVTARRSAPNG
jgi:transposase